MSRVASILVVLGILAIMGGAFAASHTNGKHPEKQPAATHPAKTHVAKTHEAKAKPGGDEGPTVVSGVVVSTKSVDGALKSFVVERPDTVPAKVRKVTVTIADGTTYTLKGADGASTDVAAGAKVLVRLASPLERTAGEASIVRVKQAGPAVKAAHVKVAHVKEPKKEHPKKDHPKKEHPKAEHPKH